MTCHMHNHMTTCTCTTTQQQQQTTTTHAHAQRHVSSHISAMPKAQFTCQIAARQPRVRLADALFFTQRWSLASNDDLTNRYAAHGSTWGLLRAKNSKICLLLTMKHDQNLSKICLRESKSANRKSASLEGKILTCPKKRDTWSSDDTWSTSVDTTLGAVL